MLFSLLSLEGRLHNPKAEVVYDVLAMQGGTKLYSRMSPLLDWAESGNGAPTQGVQEVFAAQLAELKGYETELDGLIGTDLAALNQTAGQLGVPGIYVPAK